MGNCLPRIRNFKLPVPALPPCRWKMSICIQRKRYSHKETQTYNYASRTLKEHPEGKDYINTSELWYSTVIHGVKCDSSVANTNDKTEYAIVNMPKNKQTITGSEDNNEYDYILVN